MISQTDLSKLVTFHNLFITYPDFPTDVLDPLLGNPAGYPHLFKAMWKQTGKAECLDKVTYGQEKFFSPETTHKTRQLAIESLFAKNEISYLSAALDSLQRNDTTQAMEYLDVLQSFARDTYQEIQDKLHTEESLLLAVDAVFLDKSLQAWTAKDPGERSGVQDVIKSYLSDPQETALHINAYNVKKLPDIFNSPQFKRLSELNISDSSLSDLPPSMQTLSNLISLDASHNSLSSLPPWISALSELTTLRLEENKFTVFPEVMTSLPKLNHLDLSVNQLSTLPPSLGLLTELVNLDLRDNPLKSLPMEMQKLKKLRLLNLINHSFDSFPICMIAMPQMASFMYTLSKPLEAYFIHEESFLWTDNEMDINHLIIPLVLTTALESLKKEGLAKTLEYLQEAAPFHKIFHEALSSEISALPRTLNKLLTSYTLDAYASKSENPAENRAEVKRRVEIALESGSGELDLSGLGLHTIPDFLNYPYLMDQLNLTSLDLSSNHLTSIPTMIKPLLPKLTKFSLANNPLQTTWDPEGRVTDWLEFLKYGFVSLIIDTLQKGNEEQGRKLIQHSFAFNHSFFTKTSSLAGPSLLEEAENYYLQQTLDCWKSQAEALENRKAACDLIEKYTKGRGSDLNLRDLGLKSLPNIFHLSHFANLSTLTLSNNQLTSLPESFKALGLLKFLALDGNCFSTFPKVLTNLSMLDVLVLDMNDLSYIPPDIQKLQNLNYLQLSRNSFHSIPYTVYLLPRLRLLNLNYNPCSSTLLSHQNWLPVLKDTPPAQFYCTPAIRDWLTQGREYMSAYTSAKSKEYMQDTLRRFLETAETNGGFRQSFLDIAEGALATCINGITLSFLHLRIAELQLSIDPSNLEETFATLKTLSIFGILETLAIQKIQSEKDRIDQGIADGIPLTAEQREYGKYISVHRFDREIFLTYPSRLKERFNLPFDLSEMRFGYLTPMTEADIEEAARIVEATISDPDKLHPLLIQNPLWLEALKRKAPERYAFIENEVETLSTDPATAIEAKAKQAELRTKLSQDLMGVLASEVNEPAAAKRPRG